MKKVIKTEKYVKSFFTKSEIRYIKDKGWDFILRSMIPKGCTFKYGYWGGIEELSFTSKEQLEIFEKSMRKRVKVLSGRILEDVDAYCAEIDARDAAIRKAKKDEDEIDAMLKADGMSGVYSAICNIRTGTHRFFFCCL